MAMMNERLSVTEEQVAALVRTQGHLGSDQQGDDGYNAQRRYYDAAVRVARGKGTRGEGIAHFNGEDGEDSEDEEPLDVGCVDPDSEDEGSIGVGADSRASGED